MKKQPNIIFQKFCSSAVLFIVAIITFIIGFTSIRKTAFFNLVINLSSEQCFIKPDNILLNLLFVLLVLGILYFLQKKLLPKINKKVLFILLIVFPLLVGFWWINYLKLEPISDQYMVFFCANKIVENDLKPILDPGNYLSRNPHQLGFVLYMAGLFKIFGTAKTIFIQNANIIFSCICGITMYFIIKELFKEDIIHKLGTLFILFFSIFFVFFSPHVYGNISGLAFSLIAILFVLKFINSNKIWHIIISSFTLTISYLLKSNYEIFLIAIIIELILKAIRDFEIKPFKDFIKSNFAKSIYSIVLTIVIVFGIKSIVYTSFENATGYNLNNGVPLKAYIYMGIAKPQTLGPGWYTGDVEAIYNQSGYNKEKSKEITDKLFDKRLNELSNDKGYTYGYFKNKLETTWLNPTFQSIWCSIPGIVLDQDQEYNNYIVNHKLIISIVCGKIFNLEEKAMDIFQILVFLSSSFALFTILKEASLKKLLLPLIFLGGFLFHLIWETKAIYVLQYYYLLIPYAVYGIYKLFTMIDNKISNKNKKF